MKLSFQFFKCCFLTMVTSRILPLYIDGFFVFSTLTPYRGPFEVSEKNVPVWFRLFDVDWKQANKNKLPTNNSKLCTYIFSTIINGVFILGNIMMLSISHVNNQTYILHVFLSVCSFVCFYPINIGPFTILSPQKRILPLMYRPVLPDILSVCTVQLALAA